MNRFTVFGLLIAGGAALLLGDTLAAQQKDTGKETGKKETPQVPPRKGKSEVIRLFNGKNFEGWEGHENLWSHKDGVIIGKNKDEVKVSTYLLTKHKFTDFRLTFSGRVVESEMHSGVAFWGRKAPDKGDPYTYAGHLVMFHNTWGMFDLFGRGGKLGVDTALYKKYARTKTAKDKEQPWDDIEILAQGNRIRVALNGYLVQDWRDPEPDRILEGPIGLQLHQNKMPQEVQFKDLVLTTFPEPQMITVK